MQRPSRTCYPCPPWAGVPLPQKHNGPGLLQCDPGEGGEYQVVTAGGWARVVGCWGPALWCHFLPVMEKVPQSSAPYPGRELCSLAVPSVSMYGPLAEFQALNLCPPQWGEVRMGHRWTDYSPPCSVLSQAQVFRGHRTVSFL